MRVHGQKELIKQLSDNSAPMIDAQGRGDLGQIKVWLWLTGIFSVAALIIGLVDLPETISRVSHDWSCILLSCEAPYSPIYTIVSLIVGSIFFFGILSRYRYYKSNPSMTIHNAHFNSKPESVIIVSVIILLALVIVGLFVYHYMFNLQLEETAVTVLAVIVFLIIVGVLVYAKLKGSSS